MIVSVRSIFRILPNILVYTSDLHVKLCQKPWMSLGRPLTPYVVMDLHQRLYRLHVLLKVIDANMKYLGKTQIGSCLVFYWCQVFKKRVENNFLKNFSTN